MADGCYFAAGPCSVTTGDEARQLLMKVVATIIKGQGYDGIESSAMAYILNSLESLMNSLPRHAHELAILSHRRVPSTRDFYTALQHAGPRLGQADLEQYLRDVDLEDVEWRADSGRMQSKPAWCDPFQGCLPSESEDDSAVEEPDPKESGVVATRSKVAASGAQRVKRRRKRFRPEMVEVPAHLPSLPPKHTWLSTPSYPAHSVSLQPPLAFLDLKVSSNRLMEASLRGLIRATDAAVLDSQLNGPFSSGGGQGEQQLDGDAVGTGKQSAVEGSPIANTPARTFSKRGSISQRPSVPNEASEEDANRFRLKKGRTLSLRLRTPSTSQANTTPTPLTDSPDAQSPFKPPSGVSHRPSMSLMGPQSALLPSFTSHLRRNTYSTGPWSANSSQTQFNWTSSTQPVGEAMSPLTTPLTAGVGYQYPPTPTEAQTNQVLFTDPAGRLGDSAASTSIIGLPPTVNYKRTWYKKSSSRGGGGGGGGGAATAKRIKS